MSNKEHSVSEKPTSSFSLYIGAGVAAPSQKLGAALGQRGINIMEFCKSFNEKTKDFEKSIPVRVVVRVYKDRSYVLDIRGISVSYQLKKAAGIEKGSAAAGVSDYVGKVNREQIMNIAKNAKAVSVFNISLESAARMIEGTAKSIGIMVE